MKIGRCAVLRDTGVQRGVNLGMLLGADAVCKAGEAAVKLGPEGEALANRQVGVNRSERRDMLAADLPPTRRLCIKLG